MTLTASFHPRSSYYRKRSAPLVLPEQVAWLKHVSLELVASSASDFELGVRFCDDKHETSWTLYRAFGDFRAFQKRLLRALQAGHVCHAECSWLYAVVKKHFPKRSLFPVTSQAKTQERQRALLRVLTTLQASLLNRGNHGCSVLLDKVSREFNAFLVGGSKSDDASFASERRDSLTSNDEEDSPVLMLDGAHEFDSECGICRYSLDCAEPQDAAYQVCCVTTAFSCGHQFHDACLAPAIAGAAPKCPTCGHQEV